jgi:hypothetical protein
MPSEGVASAVAGLRAVQQQSADSQLVGTVLPALLTVFALVLLAFGIPRLVGRRHPEVPATGTDPDSAEPAAPPIERAALRGPTRSPSLTSTTLVDLDHLP